jgi:hypothetical protein
VHQELVQFGVLQSARGKVQIQPEQRCRFSLSEIQMNYIDIQTIGVYLVYVEHAMGGIFIYINSVHNKCYRIEDKHITSYAVHTLWKVLLLVLIIQHGERI